MSNVVKCRTIKDTFVDVATAEVVFRPSVYAVIINKRNEVLLLPQWDGYDFPGGGQDIHETHEEALKRECHEETGLDIAIGDLIHFDEGFFFHPVREKGYHTLLFYYTVRSFSGDISDNFFDEDELEYSKKAEWIPVDKVPDIKFCNAVDNVEIIKKALSNRRALR